MLKDLQNECWESTKRRGFFRDENIPSACRNAHQMESILFTTAQTGRMARSMRKNHSVEATRPHGNVLVNDALLMSQVLRLIEEVGELCQAVRTGIKDDAIIEAADVQVTLANVASVLGVRLDDTTRAKLAADERRGILHGEAAR